MSDPPGVHNEASSETNGPVVQAGSIGHVSLTGFARGEPGGLVPRQLPLAVRDFTGRAEHLAALDALLPGDDTDDGAGAVVISAVDGAAGMGKTALAVHWAHRCSIVLPSFYRRHLVPIRPKVGGHGPEPTCPGRWGWAFPLHNNSLYPALRKFEEAGAVRKTLQLQERKPARHVYELTDVGRELLHDMLAELPRELAGSEEEFLTRVGLFDELTTEERRNTLAARDDALKARAEHFAELAERAAASENVHEWGNAVMAELRARVVPPIGACVSWALRREHPAIELTLLRHKDSALSVSLSLLSAVVTFGTLFLMPIFAQSVQGHSAFATGLALLPQGVLTGLGTVLGERLLSRITLRTLVFFGFLLLVASSLTLLLLDQNTPLWATSVILSGRVVSIGFVVNPLLFGMLQPLRDTELADGTTLFTIMQRLGGSIGVGLLSSFLTARMLSGGPVHGIHDIGLLLTGLAALASLGLPGVRQATA